MNRTALLVIDVQQGLDAPQLGRRNNPEAEANIARLLAAFRHHGLPVVHVMHDSVEPDSPLRPERPGNAIKAEAQPLPSEKLFRKTVNSAFIGTGLDDYLSREGISSLVIVGLTTEHCVSTSTRMAANLGYQVNLIADATAAFEHKSHDGIHFSAEQIHAVNLASLNGEFGTILTTAEQIACLREGAPG